MSRYISVFFIICLLSTALISFSQINVVNCENLDPINFGVNYLSTHHHYEHETADQYQYLSDDELDQHFSMFNELGIKQISLCVVWNYHEQEMGVYYETAIVDLIRVCDFAEKHDIKVIIDFHTMMSENSWTMPEWLPDRKFESIFLDATYRNAWLNFLNYTAYRLNDCESISSWDMMNEPARKEWGCNVSISEFTQLWQEMKDVFKTYSDRPVSIRFTPASIEDPEHFNYAPEIFTMFDYLGLNYYEYYCTPEKLTNVVLFANQHDCPIVITEFGSNATIDGRQDREQVAQDYQRIIGLFRSLDITDCIAWMWRADYDKGNPDIPGTKYNLAVDVNGTASPAFLLMDNKELTLSINGSGSIDGYASGSYYYTPGDEVVFSANPSNGSIFDHWEINNNNISAENPLTITVDEDKTLTAVFVEDPTELPSEDIPEFQPLIIMPISLLLIITVIAFKNRLNKKNKN